MSKNPSESSPSPSPETARAEEVVDAASRVISSFASRVWNEVAKTVALAREEAEDMVAEARSTSRGDQA